MDVRIGLVYSARELEVELADDTDVDALKAEVIKALTDDDHVLWLTDKRGSQLALSGGKITFISLGGIDKARIGFG